MLFMNEYNVEQAKRAVEYEHEDWKVTLEAIAILERLIDWANRNSDGWHSWPKPCRAAKQLQERIQEQERKASGSGWPEVYDMTHNERDAALRPIKAFLTRENVSQEDRDLILNGPKKGERLLMMSIVLTQSTLDALMTLSSNAGLEPGAWIQRQIETAVA